jgi:hypothetical protein
MKILITETQLKSLINEQSVALSPLTSYRGQEPETIKRGIKGLINMDPHDRNAILGVASLLIPVVGPYISTGIGLYDASLTYKEGKKTEAALTFTFSLLPTIGSIVSKIPGVKQLGQKGMIALADKIAKGVRTYSPAETQIVKGINLYKDTILQEVQSILKKMAAQGSKVADYQTKDYLKTQTLK